MESPVYIHNYKAIVDVYGTWPVFHDAKVLAYSRPTKEHQSLGFTVHTWQMTNQVDSRGYFVLQNHRLVSFQFDEIFDADMDAFDINNILFGIEFFQDSDGSSFRVALDSVMDKSGSFSARRGKVVSVLPYAPDER